MDIVVERIEPSLLQVTGAEVGAQQGAGRSAEAVCVCALAHLDADAPAHVLREAESVD